MLVDSFCKLMLKKVNVHPSLTLLSSCGGCSLTFSPLPDTCDSPELHREVVTHEGACCPCSYTPHCAGDMSNQTEVVARRQICPSICYEEQTAPAPHLRALTSRMWDDDLSCFCNFPRQIIWQNVTLATIHCITMTQMETQQSCWREISEMQPGGVPAKRLGLDIKSFAFRRGWKTH